MNRINEIARQCKIEFTIDPTERPMRAFVECWEDELNEFAELIVQECMDIIKPYAIHMNNFDGGHPLEDIKKHFNIK